MPRFAANLSLLFTELPLIERVSTAAAAGFSAVECQFPYEIPAAIMAAELQRSRISLILVNAPPGDITKGERGLAALKDRQSEFRQSLKTAFEYAAECQVRRLHVMAGIAAPAATAATMTYRDNLAYAADLAEKADIELLIEPINQIDMPGYFLSDFDFAAEIIQSAGSPRLRLLLDIYHRQMISGNIIAGLRSLMPIIGHIQIAGVPGRYEPTDGELNCETIFNEIDQLGYLGHIGCEYKPRAGTLDGLAWLRPYLGATNERNIKTASLFPTRPLS